MSNFFRIGEQVMLNKKCLFGGGLYLVNIIAIFASILSDVIAKTNLCDFRSELNQIAWEAKCSQTSAAL